MNTNISKNTCKINTKILLHKSIHPQTIQSLFLLLFILLFLHSCKKPLPNNIDNIFNDWFINKNSETEKILAELKLSAHTLDSLSFLLRKTASTYKSPCILKDKDGTNYTMGFKKPQSIKKDTLYPLLVYLHGGIGTMRTDKGNEAYDMFSFISDTMDIFLASPSGNRNALWWSKKGLNRILKTIRYMTLHFPIDHKRIFLAGVSDGATGCYAAANTINAPFAGFITISGFGGMLEQFGMEIIPSNIMQRPIYNIHSGNDHLYPLQVVNSFLDDLSKKGVSIKRKVYPEEKHGFDYRLMEKKTIVSLLKTWRKPSRSNISWTIVPKVPNCSDNLLSWKYNSSQIKNRILAYWQKDTLNVKTSGISSFRYYGNINTQSNVFVKIDQSKARQLKISMPKTDHLLAILQKTHNPIIDDKKIFDIEIVE